MNYKYPTGESVLALAVRSVVLGLAVLGVIQLVGLIIFTVLAIIIRGGIREELNITVLFQHLRKINIW